MYDSDRTEEGDLLEKKSGESRTESRDFRIMDSFEYVVLGKISQGLIIIDI